MESAETIPVCPTARPHGPTFYTPQPPEAQTPASPEPDGFEPHFTVQELAERWKLSACTIRRRFRDEPGVMHLQDPDSDRRPYDPLRIPRSVARRVYAERLRRRRPLDGKEPIR